MGNESSEYRELRIWENARLDSILLTVLLVCTIVSCLIGSLFTVSSHYSTCTLILSHLHEKNNHQQDCNHVADTFNGRTAAIRWNVKGGKRILFQDMVGIVCRWHTRIGRSGPVVIGLAPHATRRRDGWRQRHAARRS